MTLQAWQAAIGQLVVRGGTPAAPAPALDSDALTGEEARWLRGVADSAGFRVTCEVQRWWRDLRLRTAAPLTLASVPEAEAERLLERYLDTQAATTQFFLAEAIRFLDWVLADPAIAVPPHAGSIAAWERARLRALLASPPAPAERAPRVVQVASAATLVTFSAQPEQVLAALVAGAPLPAPGAGRWDVLVVPGRPPRWRVVDDAEARLLARCRAPQAVDASCARGEDALIARLLAEGGLAAG
ncbi:MAG TPA: hypothetical protein VFP84_16310 [Kofleriaceae bacterium]|nr:hypothetical protein [Kofleriaceae bacterium]